MVKSGYEYISLISKLKKKKKKKNLNSLISLCQKIKKKKDLVCEQGNFSICDYHFESVKQIRI